MIHARIKRIAFISVGILITSLSIASYTEATQPVKALIVTSVFPKLSEPFILDQVNGLLKRGLDVYIHAKSGDLDKMHPDVEKNNLISRTYYGELPPDIDTYDVILCQFGPRGKDFVKIKRELNLKAKVITYFRGYDITEYVNKHSKDCYKDLFAYGDLFIANCEHFKQTAIGLGCPENKILVHYSALDCNRFSYNPRPYVPGEKIRFMSTGRMVEKKGIDFALYAFDIIRREHPNCEYYIVGDGYFKKRLERIVKEQNLEDSVIFTGAYTHEELVPLLETAHIFLSPSVTAKNKNQDAIPNVIKEAMAVGIPVISTLHGGIPEMITNGVEGYLVPERDSHAIADCLHELIVNPSQWKPMGRAGRKKVVSMFETNKLNTRLAELLRTAAAHEHPTVEHFKHLPNL